MNRATTDEAASQVDEALERAKRRIQPISDRSIVDRLIMEGSEFILHGSRTFDMWLVDIRTECETGEFSNCQLRQIYEECWRKVKSSRELPPPDPLTYGISSAYFEQVAEGAAASRVRNPNGVHVPTLAIRIAIVLFGVGVIIHCSTNGLAFWLLTITLALGPIAICESLIERWLNLKNSVEMNRFAPFNPTPDKYYEYAQAYVDWKSKLRTVYVSTTGKYHPRESCHNMSWSMAMPKFTADKNGYRPCPSFRNIVGTPQRLPVFSHRAEQDQTKWISIAAAYILFYTSFWNVSAGSQRTYYASGNGSGSRGDGYSSRQGGYERDTAPLSTGNSEVSHSDPSPLSINGQQSLESGGSAGSISRAESPSISRFTVSGDQVDSDTVGSGSQLKDGLTVDVGSQKKTDQSALDHGSPELKAPSSQIAIGEDDLSNPTDTVRGISVPTAHDPRSDLVPRNAVEEPSETHPSPIVLALRPSTKLSGVPASGLAPKPSTETDGLGERSAIANPSATYSTDPQVQPQVTFQSDGQSLDDEGRIQTANRLRALGLDVDWHKHSEMQMLDWEGRIQTANRLNALGLTIDWHKYSEMEMLDWEGRIQTANRLTALGVSVDWNKHSEMEMLDWESRIQTAARLASQGLDVDWHQFTSMQLLQMEMRHRR